MDMDSRQRQIQAGAGLEESKYNVEFIDFLKRWGTPILLVVAIVSMGFFFYRRYQERLAQETDQAWVELEDARVANSPSGLLAVAEAHAAQIGVPQQARLAAADALLLAALQGVKPGGLDARGDLTGPDAALTAEGRIEQIKGALEQYRRVAGELAGKRHLEQLRLAALFGAAAAEESLGELEAAKTSLQTAISVAEDAGFAAQAAAARKRIETMGELATVPRLLAAADVKTRRPPPAPPPAPAPEPAAGAGLDLKLSEPSGLSLEPITPAQVLPPPTPTPEPAKPAETPAKPAEDPATPKAG